MTVRGAGEEVGIRDGVTDGPSRVSEEKAARLSPPFPFSTRSTRLVPRHPSSVPTRFTRDRREWRERSE